MKISKKYCLSLRSKSNKPEKLNFLYNCVENLQNKLLEIIQEDLKNDSNNQEESNQEDLKVPQWYFLDNDRKECEYSKSINDHVEK